MAIQTKEGRKNFLHQNFILQVHVPQMDTVPQMDKMIKVVIVGPQMELMEIEFLTPNNWPKLVWNIEERLPWHNFSALRGNNENLKFS